MAAFAASSCSTPSPATIALDRPRRSSSSSYGRGCASLVPMAEIARDRAYACTPPRLRACIPSPYVSPNRPRSPGACWIDSLLHSSRAMGRAIPIGLRPHSPAPMTLTSTMRSHTPLHTHLSLISPSPAFRPPRRAQRCGRGRSGQRECGGGGGLRSPVPKRRPQGPCGQLAVRVQRPGRRDGHVPRWDRMDARGP